VKNGRHRARRNPWHRLALAIGGMLKSQRRQCRAGYHRFADPTPIGGGITRSACVTCAAVSLDLRDAIAPVETRLFKNRDERKTFAVLRRQLFYRH
jgi:hypothetical protein